MKLLLLTLALVGSSAQLSTQFGVTGTFKCDLPVKWCVHARLVERNFFVDDTIDTYGAKCFQGISEERYSLDGHQYKDIFDTEYTIQLVISHNCSNHGIIRSFMSRERAVSPQKKDYRFMADYTLSSEGGLGTPASDFFN